VDERGPGGRDQRGSSLLEVAVAMFILAIVFPALALFFSTVLVANRDSVQILEDNGAAAPRRADARSFVRFQLDYANTAAFQPGATTTTVPSSFYRACSATLVAESESIVDANFPVSGDVTLDIVSIRSRDSLASPGGVADAGTSVWVANSTGSKVWRIAPASNQVVATVAVGLAPAGVLSAVGSIWVANSGSDTVSRINPANNAVTATVAVGDGPNQLAWDGTYVWVTNSAADTVSRINPTGNVVSSYPVGDNPSGIAAVGGGVFVANTGSDSLTKLTQAGAVAATVTGLRDPVGVAVGGGSVWVSNSDPVDGNNVTRVNPANAQVVTTVGLPGALRAPQGVAAEGTSVWVATYKTDVVARIDQATNAVTGQVGVGVDPVSVAAGSGRVWVSNTSAASVTRLDGAGNVVATIDVANGPCAQASDDTGVQSWKVRINSGDFTEEFEFLKVDR